MRVLSNYHGDRQAREIGLADAVRWVASQVRDFNPDNVIREEYPPRTYWGITHPIREHDGVFAYQFFNYAGQNIGYYLADLESAFLLAQPRPWSVRSHEPTSVRRFLEVDHGGPHPQSP